MEKNKFICNLYIFIVCIFCFMSILNSTYIDDIIKIYGKIYSFSQNIFIVLFTVMGILNTKLTKKRLIFLYILVILVGMILLKNNDKSLLLLVVMLISLPRKIKLSSLTVKIIVTSGIAIILVVLLCKFNFITNHIFIQRNTLRYSYGFVSANALANLVSATIIMYTFHKKNNISILNIIVCSVILLISSYITSSRGAVILGFFSLLISIYLKRIYLKENSKLGKIIFFISKNIFFVLFMFSILFTIYLSENSSSVFINELNEIFTGRIKQMIDFYKQYGMHLIGKPIITVGIKSALASGERWLGLDTAYLNYTLRYGLIFMTVLSLLYRKICTKLQKNNYIYEAVYIIIICIMGITENIILLPYYNFTLFIIAYSLKNNEQGEM